MVAAACGFAWQCIEALSGQSEVTSQDELLLGDLIQFTSTYHYQEGCIKPDTELVAAHNQPTIWNNTVYPYKLYFHHTYLFYSRAWLHIVSKCFRAYFFFNNYLRMVVYTFSFTSFHPHAIPTSPLSSCIFQTCLWSNRQQPKWSKGSSQIDHANG